MSRKLTGLLGMGLTCLLIAGTQAEVWAQGRGRGGVGRVGGSPGMGNGIGRPSGTGVERGIDTSSDRSSGRADIGRGTAAERSGGRSNSGLERARLQRENARRADEELRDHPGMPAKLHTTANDLRDGYRVALAHNPELKFGEYVAASRLSANLHGRHANVTRDGILAGVARGNSIGQTLQDLGLSGREAREARATVERELKESKRR